MTTFERLAHQKTKILGQDIARLGQRIARQKVTIKAQQEMVRVMESNVNDLTREIRRNEAVIAGLLAQIAKLQGVKA